MVRFAVIVAAAEILLTVGAAFFITLTNPLEPYLTEQDALDLGLPCIEVRVSKGVGFNRASTFSTQIELADTGQVLDASCQFDVRSNSFDGKLERARGLERIGEKGEVTLTEEDSGVERGYNFVQKSVTYLEIEIIRSRARTLAIVRITGDRIKRPWNAQEIVESKRRAREAMKRLREKLGWK